MSFAVYLPKKPVETSVQTFKHAMSDTGAFIMRIGRKVLKIGAIALFRNQSGDLCRTKLEGATADGQYLYGHNGMFLAVAEFKRTWRLQTPIL